MRRWGTPAAKGSPSSFNASLAPLILWRLNDRLLFEGAFDIGVSNADGSGSTSFELTIADISYIVNDYLTVGGGLFVAPFGVYHNHFDPPWINKLPDDPLVFSDGGLAPGSIVGAFATGAVPVGSMKFTYDFYVSNGARLITDDPGAAGSLDFGNYDDNNNAKSVGGRVSILPIPQLEIGYSFMVGDVNTRSEFKDVSAFLQAFDLEYRRDVQAIKGTIDLRTELVWSNVDKATYDPTGAPHFGPVGFRNHRNGGYVQAAYRPSLVTNKIVKNLEVVLRHDWLTSPVNGAAASMSSDGRLASITGCCQTPC